MDKSTRKSAFKIRLVLGGSILLSIICAVLRTLAYLFSYDTDIGYFVSGAPLHIASNVMTVLSLVFFAAVTFSSKIDFFTDGKEKNIGVKLASILCGGLFFAWGIYSVMKYQLNFQNIIFIAILFLSSFYFFMNLVNKHYDSQALLGVAVIAWAIYVLTITYFDSYTQINSPNKIILHMACMASMLFFVTEAKAISGTMKKRSYVFFLASSILLISVCAIPSWIATLNGAISDSRYSIFYVPYIAEFIYLIARGVTLLFTCDKEVPVIENSDADDAVKYDVVEEETTDGSDESTFEKSDIPSDVANEDESTECNGDTFKSENTDDKEF